MTLVPDSVDAITSNAGWDTIKHKEFLTDVIKTFKSAGIRTSIFVDPDPKMIEGAKVVGTDRIELYTESYAVDYEKNKEKAILPFVEAAKKANELGLGINAGHDLSLKNIPNLLEVSIGHALISEALYLGLDNVVNMYLQRLK